MDAADLALGLGLAVTTLVLGLWLAVPLARSLATTAPACVSMRRRYGLLVVAYLLECVAFAAGVATQVFTLGLAVVWGALLGWWLRSAQPLPALRAAFYLALYTCLPTGSFAVIVPAVWAFSGNSLVSVSEGWQFGIPQFVPWPLSTVAGFAIALAAGTVVLKSFITVGSASLMLHFTQHSEGERPGAVEDVS